MEKKKELPARLCKVNDELRYYIGKEGIVLIQDVLDRDGLWFCIEKFVIPWAKIKRALKHYEGK